MATDFKGNLLNSVAQLTHRMKTSEKAAERWSSEWLVALTINVQLEVVRKL